MWKVVESFTNIYLKAYYINNLNIDLHNELTIYLVMLIHEENCNV